MSICPDCGNNDCGTVTCSVCNKEYYNNSELGKSVFGHAPLCGVDIDLSSDEIY